MKHRSNHSFGKRALSVVLTLALSLSFAALFSGLFKEELTAEAATAGYYYVEVYWKVTNKGSSLGPYNGYANFNQNKDNNNKIGFSLFYKTNNGTGTEYEVWWDVGHQNHGHGSTNPSGTDVVTNSTGYIDDEKDNVQVCKARISGFPTRLFAANDYNNFMTDAEYEIIKIAIGSTDKLGHTLWQGTVHLNSSTKQKYTWIYPYYTAGSTNNGNDSSNAYTKTDAISWTSPYAATVTAIQGPGSVAVPTDGRTSYVYSNAYTAGTVRDQYGVNWYQDATLSMTNTHNGVTFANNKIGVSSAANADDYYEMTLKETCGAATGEKSVMVRTFDYRIDFFDEDGTTRLIETQSAYYDDPNYALPDTPEKEPTASVHYVFDGWKKISDALWFTPGQAIKGGQQNRAVKAGYRTEEHNWVEVQGADHRVSIATCLAPATYYKSCSVCGINNENETFTVGTELGHNFTQSNARIHSLGNGTHNWMCSRRCGHYGIIEEENQVEGGAVPCNFGSWTTVTKATCSEPGERQRTCRKCGYVETEVIPALEHNWVTTPNNRHLISVANCVTPATYHVYCSACGEDHPTDTFTDGEPTLGGHPAESFIHAEATPATCTENGNKEYWYCEVCDQYFSNAEGTVPFTGSTVILSEGHDFTGEVRYVDPDHHQWKCTRCEAYGAVIDGLQTPEATVECSYTEWTGNGEVTCTTGGELSRYCTVCGNTQNRILEPQNHDFSAEEVKESALKTAATCTEKAVYYYSCANCSLVEGDDGHTFVYGTPLYHDFTGGCSNVESGKHNFKCRHCSLFGVGAGVDAVVNGVEDCYGGIANCTSQRICSKCRIKYGEIDPANHKNLRRVAPKDPTCMVSGNIEYWFCSGCSKFYSDAEAQNETTQDQVILAKLEHSYTGEARDNGNGTHSLRCVNGCGKYGDPTEHTWDDGVYNVTANCTLQGEKTYTCTAEGCCATKVDYAPALGHSLGAWEPNGDDGHIRRCANCTYTETDSHHWDEGEYQTGFSCLTGGTLVYTCAECGKTKTKQGPPGSGHIWGAWETIKDGSTETMELQRATCIVCGAIQERNVPVEGSSGSSDPVGNLNRPSFWDWILGVFRRIAEFFKSFKF